MGGGRPRVAILGGGMGGLAAAWRLSEPGWQDRFDRIVVYQRGWRLGGKGASSRGANGRIEEHGLHVWLGFYENAFRLVRECYAELDRPTTDPQAPIRTWRDAFTPAPTIGVEDRHGDEWHHWLARFSPNDLEPGDPSAPAVPADPLEFARRGVQLVLDALDSLAGAGAVHGAGRERTTGVRLVLVAALVELTRLASVTVGDTSTPGPDGDDLGDALGRARSMLADALAAEPELKRSWQVVSLTLALVRGLAVDRVLTDPNRLGELDEEDYLDWIGRHGADADAVRGGFLRGLYDLVMGYEGGDPDRPRFGAGTALLLAMKLALEYKGAMFWKMQAGMGDVVFAPLYQALRQRGVDFAFFHRVDHLHLSADRTAIEAITVGRQARLADGLDRYEPLVRVRGLPCFPNAPLGDQLHDAAGIEDHPLESHWCTWPDAERVVLRRGVDFDVAVLAVPPPMAGLVGRELVDDRPDWHDMVTQVATVATQSFQLWLREPEPALGWPDEGATVSGYVAPFGTWASMPQLVDVEDWPADDRPAAIAYFCGALAAPWPPPPGSSVGPAYQVRQSDRVRVRATTFLDRDLRHLLPGTHDEHGFRWNLLCGPSEGCGPEAFASQYWAANVDPSDRYVQSLPGTGRYRLRADESGYDNLFLAGDWTDSGLNAGCIEAAALSGLQAANAALGRARGHRIVGYLPA